MFSPTLLSLFIILHYYYYCLYCFLLLFVITVIIISTELLALCDGCLGGGWVWRAGARGWVGLASLTILGDPGALVGTGKSLKRAKKKFGRRKVKNKKSRSLDF